MRAALTDARSEGTDRHPTGTMGHPAQKRSSYGAVLAAARCVSTRHASQ
jgi:hypothetical protein